LRTVMMIPAISAHNERLMLVDFLLLGLCFSGLVIEIFRE